uniref:Uncharacterized protein n=1 Tax=Molossus molossus TaxID=27622 RepID=A0A7J8BYC8_MOLMO|nr:hypothetical protein HJG59_010016 [Molossus molossus]
MVGRPRHCQGPSLTFLWLHGRRSSCPSSFVVSAPAEALVLGIGSSWLRFAVTCCNKAVELNEILFGGISLLPSALLFARGKGSVQRGQLALSVQTPAPARVPPDLQPLGCQCGLEVPLDRRPVRIQSGVGGQRVSLLGSQELSM